MKKMRHVHPRCGLVRDQPAKGKNREEWTPKRHTGSTGIRGSLYLLHHWFEMLFPRKISEDKDAKSTNGDEQLKKGRWSTTIKLPTDEIELLPETPRDPDHDEAMMDAGPLELEAIMNALSLSNNNWVDDSAWQYFAEKYNAEREVGPVCEFHREIEPVKCPIGQDLVKYLARERSQSNPHCMRNNLLWCQRRESLDQEYIHNVRRLQSVPTEAQYKIGRQEEESARLAPQGRAGRCRQGVRSL
jgi:hypothetical protein